MAGAAAGAAAAVAGGGSGYVVGANTAPSRTAGCDVISSGMILQCSSNNSGYRSALCPIRRRVQKRQVSCRRKLENKL